MAPAVAQEGDGEMYRRVWSDWRVVMGAVVPACLKRREPDDPVDDLLAVPAWKDDDVSRMDFVLLDRYKLDMVSEMEQRKHAGACEEGYCGRFVRHGGGCQISPAFASVFVRSACRCAKRARWGKRSKRKSARSFMATISCSRCAADILLARFRLKSVQDP